MANTKIQWTDKVWNPVTGCNKVSAGCKNCYAEAMAKRLKAMGLQKYKNGFEVTTHYDELFKQFKWKKPQKIFVNSMSDLFHDEVPFSFINKVFKVISDNQRHIFQILTKRPSRALCYFIEENLLLKWYSLSNLWLGVSVENQQVIGRADTLAYIPAKVRFLSCEPMLGNVNLSEYFYKDKQWDRYYYKGTQWDRYFEGQRERLINRFQWVICGAESGPKKRPMDTAWAIDLANQCKEAGVPFFMKQMFDGKGKKMKFEDFPAELQKREFPEDQKC